MNTNDHIKKLAAKLLADPGDEEARARMAQALKRAGAEDVHSMDIMTPAGNIVTLSGHLIETRKPMKPGPESLHLDVSAKDDPIELVLRYIE